MSEIKTQNVSLDDLINGTNLAPSVDVFAKQQSSYEKDERIYKPTMGANGNENIITGYFLPSLERIMINGVPTSMPIASYWQHGFEEGNQKVNEICPKSITQIFGVEKSHRCAICDYNKALYPYSDGESDDVKQARSKRKPKQVSYVNFYIEEDSLNADNNGKVVILKLNYQMLGMIKKLAEGVKHKSIENKYIENPVDVFKINKNFMQRKFIIIASPSQMNAKWNDYAKSRFASDELFLNGDINQIKTVLSKTYNLFEEIILKQFEKIKSEDALKSLVDSMYGTDWCTDVVRGENPNSPENIRASVEKAKQKEVDESKDDYLPKFSEPTKKSSAPAQETKTQSAKPTTSAKPKVAPAPVEEVAEEDGDVDVDFSKLYGN